MPNATLIAARFPRISEYHLRQGAVIIPLAVGFVTPSTPSWALIFYLTAIPPLLLTLWRGWHPAWHDRALASILALWGWSALTIAWTHHDSIHGKTTTYWIVEALWTLVLVLNFVSATEEDPRTRDRAMQAVIYGGAVNAGISLVLFILKGDFTTRLWGYGLTGNPVMGAAIMDIGLLLALIRAREDRRRRLPMAAAAAPMIAFLGFSYSRTALLALAVALLVILFGQRPLLAGLAAALLGALGLVLLKFGHALFPALWNNLVSRGDDCHAALWRAAWQAIRLHPLIGYGPSATLPSMPENHWCPPNPSPHNFYLCLLYYSGAVGFALFALTVAMLWRRLHAATRGITRRLWLGVGLIPLIVGLSDLVQIDKGPSVMWYIVWIPMLLVLTLPPPGAQASATRAFPRARARQ